MQEHQYDISGIIVFWSLQPTAYNAVKAALEGLGYGDCVPNPRTDQSALQHAIKGVCGTKNKTIVSRKQPKRNGVELVEIERDAVHNSYTTSFGAKVVHGRVKADYGFADEDRLTDEYTRSKAVLTSAAMSQALVAVLEKLDGMRGFDKAGVHYVPEHALDAWKRVAESIEGCHEGNRVTCIRAAMDAGTARAITHASTKEVQEQAAQLLEDVSKGTLSDGQLQVRAERAQALVARVDLYSDIISDTLDGLKNVAKLVQGAAAAVMQDFAQAGVCV